ncbi:MAG: AbrB/MazE/SpoVT family DNA-binding domain-containing protein [Hyphomonadaceae bacterium]|nr:AbrB/MazE/SpoVT family DNA-binding domain-containing protein [Hyphomonadaceae bacterium]
MRITSKGQVTIPQDVREAAGLMPGTDVEIVIERGAVILRKRAPGKRPSRGRKLVERLRGASDFGGMSADEVIALMRGPLADADAPPRKRR